MGWQEWHARLFNNFRREVYKYSEPFLFPSQLKSTIPSPPPDFDIEVEHSGIELIDTIPSVPEFSHVEQIDTDVSKLA